MITGIVVTMIIIIISHQAFAQNMGGRVEVAHYQISQTLALGNSIYVTYQENSNSGPGNVFFRSSVDGGKNFGNIIKLNYETGDASEPYVTVSGNNVYVAWDSSSLSDNSKHVFFRKSTDGGNSFGDAQLLDSGPQSGNTFIEQLATNGPNVYALMKYGNTTGNWNLLLKESNDYGKTFDKPIILNEVGSSLTSKITISGTNVYVSSEYYANCSPMCRQSDIVLRQSVDNGSTFGGQINLSKGDDISNYHQMVTSDNDVYVAWQEGQFPHIFFTKSADGGHTFSAKTDLSHNIGESTSAHLTAQGNNVYVAFYHYDNAYDKNNYKSGIYFTKSSDGGSTFSNPTLIHDYARPEIFGFAASSNDVFFSYGYEDTFGSPETLLIKSTDNGTSFGNPVLINKGLLWTGGFEGLAGGLTAHENHVYVILRSTMPVDYLYVMASNNHGKDFGPLINLNHEENKTILCCSDVFVDAPRPANIFQEGSGFILLLLFGIPVAVLCTVVVLKSGKKQ